MNVNISFASPFSPFLSFCFRVCPFSCFCLFALLVGPLLWCSADSNKFCCLFLAISIACLTLYPAEPLHVFGLTDKASAYSLSVSVPDIMCKAQAGTGSFPLESAMLTGSFLQYANMFLQTSSIPVEINPSAFKNLLTAGS